MCGAYPLPLGLPLALRTGLESPYLLHQMLAFSARHLAHLHPQRAGRVPAPGGGPADAAVSLFNAAGGAAAVDSRPDNYVAMLLFSSVLGHDLLADVLARRDDSRPADPASRLDAFMACYVQCAELHRGVFAVAARAWPLLMTQSELEPILSRGFAFTSRAPRGDHCRRARELVDGADGLTDGDKDACRQAVRHLQVGFDAALADQDEDDELEGNRYHMIFSWAMVSPPELTALLAAKRPEVLVLLAYFALLLHYGRTCGRLATLAPTY